jgi:peptidoglycan/LPS O-acetylase OafA/YrhL
MTTSIPKPTTPRVRLDYIDALRGIAALMVMICHCVQIDSTLHLAPHTSEVMEAFKYGVQLFFVISAFTIFYSLYSSDAGTYNFFIRRFFRIAPLYFVAVIGYGFLYGADALGLGLNIAFLHGFSPKYINSVVPGGWSIGVEMVFYCMVPFLFRLVTSIRSALYFFLGTLLLSFLLFYIYRKAVAPTSDLESFMYFWLPNQLPAFGLGIIVYFLTFQGVSNSIRNTFYPLTILALLILFVLITGYPIFSTHVLFAAASGLFIFMLKVKSFPGIVNRMTLYLGKISYSLYLSQYAAIYIVQRTGLFSFFKTKTGLYAYLNTGVNLIMLFITTVVLSFILYHVIELPFQNFGKRFLKSRISYSDIMPADKEGSVKAVADKNRFISKQGV